MKKLFLIDAYALIFRFYYAFIGRPMRNADGVNTSAVFGFVRYINEIIRRENPHYLGVAFDPPGGNFRHELFADYKANRGETPELRENKGDFFFLQRPSGERLAATVAELCSERLPRGMGIPSGSVIVSRAPGLLGLVIVPFGFMVMAVVIAVFRFGRMSVPGRSGARRPVPATRHQGYGQYAC